MSNLVKNLKKENGICRVAISLNAWDCYPNDLWNYLEEENIMLHIDRALKRGYSYIIYKEYEFCKIFNKSGNEIRSYDKAYKK